MTNQQVIDNLNVSDEIKEKIKIYTNPEDLEQDCKDFGYNEADWLAAMFIWKNTPEGHSYWSFVSSQLSHQKW